ncbi:GGDEF domain-containing protein [Lactiplantibacillus songbeiensis]|uniref:GGDEF domain-containing protein n=1 Tax=Lactiplantibacillus songbeiensis TaxID=2559920 RepID=A0ABW4C0W3_9LACO|nr:GGDEF domain-containing protein [Lactiplantibacillus songbeiensis]
MQIDQHLVLFFEAIFNMKTVIIAFMTTGLIALMSVGTYILEHRALKIRRRRFTWTVHVVETASVLLSMLIIRSTFYAINDGSVLTWSYATAQLTILLFALYTMWGPAIGMLNIIMPVFIYSQGIYLGSSWRYAPIFAVMVTLLIAGIVYFAWHRTEVMASKWQYFLLQAIYGGTWWFIIWAIHPFNLFFTVLMLVIFMAYIGALHRGIQWMSRVLERYSALSQQVNFDELTGVRNRGNFDTVKAEVFEVYRKRTRNPITMAMFDIDHFKQFNDLHGHTTGDAVLKYVAQHFEQELLAQQTHGELFRYGGEEFVVIFRSVAVTEAAAIVSSIRSDLQQRTLDFDGQALHITVSFGVSQLQPEDQTFSDWFARVDHYLYQSKQAGRNRVTVEGKTLITN